MTDSPRAASASSNRWPTNPPAPISRIGSTMHWWLQQPPVNTNVARSAIVPGTHFAHHPFTRAFAEGAIHFRLLQPFQGGRILRLVSAQNSGAAVGHDIRVRRH